MQVVQRLPPLPVCFFKYERGVFNGGNCIKDVSLLPPQDVLFNSAVQSEPYFLEMQVVGDNPR